MVRRKAELLDLLREQESRAHGARPDATAQPEQPPARRQVQAPVRPAPRPPAAPHPAGRGKPGLTGGQWILAGVLGVAAVALLWWMGSLFAGGQDARESAASDGEAASQAGSGVYAIRLAVYPESAEVRARQVLGWLLREGYPEAGLLRVTRESGRRLELFVGASAQRDAPELATLLERVREIWPPDHPQGGEPPFRSAYIVEKPRITGSS